MMMMMMMTIIIIMMGYEYKMGTVMWDQQTGEGKSRDTKMRGEED
jgi:hypothetical protein